LYFGVVFDFFKICFCFIKKENPRHWAVRHSDKLPIKGVYSRHSALKMLKIHKKYFCAFCLDWQKSPPFIGAKQF